MTSSSDCYQLPLIAIDCNRLPLPQLFGLANDVIKRSDDEGVHKFNQRSTTINVGGGGASASRNIPPRAICSVCQLPVRGMHAWCQGCGHGGHANCLRDWLTTSTECPAGCGHRCQLRLVPRCAARTGDEAVAQNAAPDAAMSLREQLATTFTATAPTYPIGSTLEVLRSDGLWSLCTIKDF